MDAVEGNGVQLGNIVISHWTGTAASGNSRGPIKIMCADGAPCTGIDITDFAMWTETDDSQWYSCRSAYTSFEDAPLCLQPGSDAQSYKATTSTVSSAPTGYQAVQRAEGLKSDFGTTVSIQIPTFAATMSFFPGVPPVSILAVNA